MEKARGPSKQSPPVKKRASVPGTFDGEPGYPKRDRGKGQPEKTYEKVKGYSKS